MNHVLVSYPARREQKITVAEHELMLSLSGEPLMAIKFLRKQYNLGLAEAKHLFETIRDNSPSYNQRSD